MVCSLESFSCVLFTWINLTHSQGMKSKDASRSRALSVSHVDCLHLNPGDPEEKSEYVPRTQTSAWQIVMLHLTTFHSELEGYL